MLFYFILLFFREKLNCCTFFVMAAVVARAGPFAIRPVRSSTDSQFCGPAIRECVLLCRSRRDWISFSIRQPNRIHFSTEKRREFKFFSLIWFMMQLKSDISWWRKDDRMDWDALVGEKRIEDFSNTSSDDSKVQKWCNQHLRRELKSARTVSLIMEDDD